MLSLMSIIVFEVSMHSSIAEVSCSENEFVSNEKKLAPLLQRKAVPVVSVCKQQTSEGVVLHISSTTPTYPLLPGNSEVPFLSLLLRSIRKGKAFKLSMSVEQGLSSVIFVGSKYMAYLKSVTNMIAGSIHSFA